MKRHHIILFIILLIGLFFRTYQIVERFEFAHDGDLYSWIVKDIVVSHHFRIIGQETSASGIFIGPLFYYLIAPFFLTFNMDPAGAIVPITIIGILTVFSYYWVFYKLFNKKVGLIAAFLYAVLLNTVEFDRHVFPSTLTNLWAIWYFYTVISLSRGNFKVLPLLGILIGLIWHIHIALIPSLSAIPVAFFLSHKLPSKKQILFFAIALFVTSLPLIIFEFKHGFQQTFSLLNNFTLHREGAARGFYKFQQVLEMITKNINSLFLSPQSLPYFLKPLFVVSILTLTIPLFFKKLISQKEIIALLAWIIGIVAFFSLSSSLISEYYFYNLQAIFICLVSLIAYLIYKSSKIGAYLVICLLVIVLIKNLYLFITSDIYHKGYIERKLTANYISKDSETKRFPCVGINYITSLGENVGFRYFFYLNNLHTVPPSNNVAVYSIVIPDEYSREVEKKFGHIGIITPKNVPSSEIMRFHCSGGNSNLTDPLFGYVE